MEAVRVTRWLKNVGDTVTQGEPLVDVEKSVVEIEATVSGRLVEIRCRWARRQASAIRSRAWEAMRYSRPAR